MSGVGEEIEGGHLESEEIEGGHPGQVRRLRGVIWKVRRLRGSFWKVRRLRRVILQQVTRRTVLYYTSCNQGLIRVQLTRHGA